jgi:hypothetical protein
MRVDWAHLRGREEGFVNASCSTPTPTAAFLRARVRAEAVHTGIGIRRVRPRPGPDTLIEYYDTATPTSEPY